MQLLDGFVSQVLGFCADMWAPFPPCCKGPGEHNDCLQNPLQRVNNLLGVVQVVVCAIVFHDNPCCVSLAAAPLYDAGCKLPWASRNVPSSSSSADQIWRVAIAERLALGSNVGFN